MSKSESLNNNELKALISLLDDDDGEVLKQVEGRILSLGTHIIPYLESERENSSDTVFQKRIEELVHSLQYELLKERLLEWKKGEQQDLLKGIWLINTYHYPHLEFEELRKELEQICNEFWLEYGSHLQSNLSTSEGEVYMNFEFDIDSLDPLTILNSVLFSKLKFAPNTKNSHSPDNSMMNVVLQTKKGNPISLCIIYALIARKIGLSSIYGVNLPHLFVLTYKKNDRQFYIDASNQGGIFTRKEIDKYISNLKLPHNDSYYEPCNHIEIIARVLRNLIHAHEKLGHTDKVQEIQTLLNLMTG